MLYFHHIPKTAGISVRQLLSDYFHESDIAPCTYHPELFKIPPTDLKKYALIRGHFTSGLPSYVGCPCDVITFLRRPIDQALSMFFHQKELGLLPSDISLQEVLDTEKCQRVINLQSRWLASHDCSTNGLGYDDYIPTQEEALRVCTDRQILDAAKRELDAMRFVGIVERFFDSYVLLCQEFGWPAQRTVPRLNVTASKNWSLVSPESVQRLEGLLGLDEELYRYACGLFQAHRDSLAHEPADARYRRALCSLSREDTVLVRFAEPLHGRGWYERERLADGSVARWTGPDRLSTLHLALAIDRDLCLTFRIVSTLHPANVDCLKVRINGVDLALERLFSIRGDYNDVVCRARIPVTALDPGSGITELEFEVPETIKPKDLDPNCDDDRSLGVMINWVSITPYFDPAKSGTGHSHSAMPAQTVLGF